MGTDASGSTEAVLAENTLGPTIRLRAPQAAIDLDARGIDHLAADWASNPYLEPLLSARGGHLGFHARDAESAWHDRCAALFFERAGQA